MIYPVSKRKLKRFEKRPAFEADVVLVYGEREDTVHGPTERTVRAAVHVETSRGGSGVVKAGETVFDFTLTEHVVGGMPPCWITLTELMEGEEPDDADHRSDTHLRLPKSTREAMLVWWDENQNDVWLGPSQAWAAGRDLAMDSDYFNLAELVADAMDDEEEGVTFFKTAARVVATQQFEADDVPYGFEDALESLLNRYDRAADAAHVTRGERNPHHSESAREIETEMRQGWIDGLTDMIEEERFEVEDALTERGFPVQPMNYAGGTAWRLEDNLFLVRTDGTDEFNLLRTTTPLGAGVSEEDLEGELFHAADVSFGYLNEVLDHAYLMMKAKR